MIGPEDKFKARILKELHALGGWWYTTPRTRFGRAGIPDIMGCFLGMFIAIEVKRPDGRGSYGVTASQQRVLDTIKAQGGEALVVDSEEDLQSLVKELHSWNVMEEVPKC
jgi:hypothetical protein